jgi:hypothetical protein
MAEEVKWLIVVLLAAASAGCFPVRPAVREARGGAVLDAQTRAPVAGATVRVESYEVKTPPGCGGGTTLRETMEVKTDTSGRWSVPSKHEWTVGMLAADGLPLYLDVYCVFADGYVNEVRNPHWSWFERKPSTAADAPDGRQMEAALLLQRRDPSSKSNPAESAPAVTRSCF